MSPDDVQHLLLDNITTVATTAGLLVTAVVAVILLVRCRGGASSAKSGDDGVWWNETNQKGKRNNESNSKKSKSTKKTKTTVAPSTEKQNSKTSARPVQSDVVEVKRQTNQVVENASSAKTKSKKQNVAGNKASRDQQNKLETPADDWTVAVSKKKKSKKDNEEDNVDHIKPQTSSSQKHDDSKVPVAQVPEFTAQPVVSETPVASVETPHAEVSVVDESAGKHNLLVAGVLLKSEFQLEPAELEAEEEDVELLAKERNRLRREKKKARNKKGAEQREAAASLVELEHVNATLSDDRSLAENEIKQSENYNEEEEASSSAAKKKKKSKNKSTKKEEEQTVNHSHSDRDDKEFTSDNVRQSTDWTSTSHYSEDDLDRFTINQTASSSFNAASTVQTVPATSSPLSGMSHEADAADSQSDFSAAKDNQSQQGVVFDELQEFSVPESGAKQKKKKARKDL